jgi:hypothetical protein
MQNFHNNSGRAPLIGCKKKGSHSKRQRVQIYGTNPTGQSMDFRAPWELVKVNDMMPLGLVAKKKSSHLKR